jgi:hypothetical protein
MLTSAGGSDAFFARRAEGDPRVVFVDRDATGAGDGSSWANAFTTPQAALAHAASHPEVAEVWVAEGAYSGPFSLVDSLALYGGFEGTETSVEQRDPLAHTTSLSGGTHVVSVQNVEGFLLDGFQITGGNAGSADGGGLLITNSEGEIAQCAIVNNRADEGAGYTCKIAKSSSGALPYQITSLALGGTEEGYM